MDGNDRRKKVMSRSIKLGHCVCDPRKPCPCPLFREKNVCTCAGERVEPDRNAQGVRLTDYVRSAGCASKIGQKDLREVIALLPEVKDPRLVVGTATADDAGVFRISPTLTVVQTVDVFTPGVDDPYLFGKIAACNSLSDVYAMGGRPVTALSIIGFPIEKLPHGIMAEIIRGGMAVLSEAETILLGGHSINDEEIKFGFAVTGVLECERPVTNSGALPGDLLVLTKPLGTGIVSFAHQLGKASPESVKASTDSMTSLNRIASETMLRRRANACTDVTGFGFLGHLSNIVSESGVTAEVWCDALPILPGALDYARAGMFPGACEKNADYSAAIAEFDNDVPEEIRTALFDAQTSGGLLIALPENEAAPTVEDLQAAGIEQAAIIGRITERSKGRIIVRSKAGGRFVPASSKQKEKRKTMNERKKIDATDESACCAHGSETPDKALGMFKDFMGSAMGPGAVDVVTKEIVAVALGLAVNCVPCSRIHIKKALDMGISPSELEEAAALAVAFAGCRALMLWTQMKQELMYRGQTK